MKKRYTKKDRIMELEHEVRMLLKSNSKYYDAIYEIKRHLPGLRGTSVYGGDMIMGNETVAPVRTLEQLVKLVEALPD